MMEQNAHLNDYFFVIFVYFILVTFVSVDLLENDGQTSLNR